MEAATNQTRLSDLLMDLDGDFGSYPTGGSWTRGAQARLVAEAEWRAAIAALTRLLPALPRPTQAMADGHHLSGLALSGPVPVLNEADFGPRFESWVVTPQPLAHALQGQHALLPSEGVDLPTASSQNQILPLTLNNPLLAERFCLVASPALSVALVLGEPTGRGPCFQYSFDPATLLALWQQVRQHIAEPAIASLDYLDERFSQAINPPDYRVITRFTQGMMAQLPHRQSATLQANDERGQLRFTHWSDPTSRSGEVLDFPSVLPAMASEPRTDILDHQLDQQIELLQAMAHEIRTPLTTIRTLTRSLLRRKDVTAAAKQRLQRIDAECTQQIDRFNLIFRAVELETTERDRPRSSLTPIALNQIFQDAIPKWQQQAERRNLKLDVHLPPHLPRVTSDPTLLHEVLNGVVEWFTQCLPPQSHVHMGVMLAGHQLKLQFEAEPLAGQCATNADVSFRRPPLKSVGQLLSVVPETGGVSLNLDVTKNLFEFLGGKLILRHRPDQGDVLTAFLPLDTREI
ncbi:sensor histidine kinase [Leptolyngbya iicbica]|uniref:histidine kinase n=2 Tax=Cyanophyceae TaxID=3028117 RepID=A0A4Q7E4D3_9CYAN|nr:HAMP domain-containing sensor histidine kinase [Leptolyngbya sp. LK]RZM77123.1 sensor histidine kinase [Leptolyngbya sp. LK]